MHTVAEIAERYRVSADLAEPFKSVIEPICDDLVKYNREKLKADKANTSKANEIPSLTDFLEKITNHVSNFLDVV